MEILINDTLNYLFGFLGNLDLLKLKWTCKKFNKMISLKSKKLLENIVDFWCQVLLDFNQLKYFLKYFPMNENLIISIGYINFSHFSVSHYKYNISESKMKCTFKNSGISFDFDLMILLKKLNKYNDMVIKNCINFLPQYFRLATKPYHNQNYSIDDYEDFSYNPEEFFWSPQSFSHEKWFKKKYRFIYNILKLK